MPSPWTLPSPWRLFAALLLSLCVFNAGCASSRLAPAAGGAEGVVTCSTDHDHGAEGALAEARGGEKIAGWVLVGLLIGFVVTIDLMLLPWTSHDPFPCCRAVVQLCH